jgi:GNAT superfamily N-acetyltransferase
MTLADRRSRAQLRCVPLTPARWADLEMLFGVRGACGGCWCMAWRVPRSDWEAQKGAPNKAAMRRLVQAGPPPGILAYRGAEPVGWCAVAPRESYPVLARSRVLAPVDDRAVWSVTCLFVRKTERRQGVSRRLLQAAVSFARGRGARIVEGYPMEPDGKWPDPFVWTGLASAFRAVGFREVARRSKTRPIMRRTLRARAPERPKA